MDRQCPQNRRGACGPVRRFCRSGITERDLQKHAMIEVCHLTSAMPSRVALDSPDSSDHATMLLVLYQQNETGQPQYYTMPVELAKQAK